MIMLRSKSRSGSVDFGLKNNHHSSLFSRTLSASKLCRGDAIGQQIDSNALKSVDKKKPSKISNLSNNKDRIMSMQLQMGEMEEELRQAKEKLSVMETEKYRALDQLREAKEANSKSDEGLSMEIDNLKKTLSDSRDELRTKDKKIDSLQPEITRLRQLEIALAEKDASLDKLSQELRDVKQRERATMLLLSENKKRIYELEGELERERKSGSRMADSLVLQGRQLEATIFQLEESKIETTSLHEKIDSLEELYKQNSREFDASPTSVGRHNDNCRRQEQEHEQETIRSLKIELQMVKDNLAQAREGENAASLKAKGLVEEMEKLRNECKSAMEAEEKSTKAMEDLALALKEVATEAKQAKEKLSATQTELELVKGEAEQLKEMVRNTEVTYQNLLNEAKQEAELHKNTADRLRVEADEALLAWNGKEIGFVGCIKRAEEERAIAQIENTKLAESLKAAENMTRAAREETYKLRDILKQAVNEANAAKAAAGIARDENSLLKDSLVEKDEALHFLTRENERLRISEAAAQENVKQLKRLLSSSSELRIDDKIHSGLLSEAEEDEGDEDEEGNPKNMQKAFSFNLDDLKFMNEPEDVREKILDEDPEKAEALKGSIFDTNAETPKSEVRTPKTAQKRYHPTAFSEDEGTPKLEDGDRVDQSDSEDAEKHSHRRSKTVLQRVGDLLYIRRSFHKREPSVASTN